MISAAGFASVMTHTGDINQLVKGVVEIIGDNRALAAFLMLCIGCLSRLVLVHLSLVFLSW